MHLLTLIACCCAGLARPEFVNADFLEVYPFPASDWGPYQKEVREIQTIGVRNTFV